MKQHVLAGLTVALIYTTSGMATAQDAAKTLNFLQSFLGGHSLQRLHQQRRPVVWRVRCSGRPNLPWTFAVLDDPGFNAFAAPGGYIFVTKGLIDRVADESELAGILAHEIVHVTSKHHLVAPNKAARAGLLTQAISSQLGNDMGGLVSGQLLALGRNMYSKGLGQSDELQADRSGVALAARAGLDPYGLLAVLQQMRTMALGDALLALSMSTHPPAQLRLNQLELAMGNRLDAYSGQAALTIAQRMQRLAASPGQSIRKPQYPEQRLCPKRTNPGRR